MPKTEEQCKQIREDTKNKILKMSSLYFVFQVKGRAV